jgi:peptide deformylase
MAIRPIVKFGTPVLHSPAEPLTEFPDSLEELVQDMLQTMYAAPGVGLAAPQIGLNMQLFVIDTAAGEDPQQPIVMANPEIIEQEGEQREEEGCLSVPGYHGVVVRPTWVKVRGRDIKGKEIVREGTGLLARAFCHETDHLNATLFIDRLGALKRDLMKRKIKKLIRQGDW